MKKIAVAAVLGYGRIGKIHFNSLVSKVENVKVKYLVDQFITKEDEQLATDKGVKVLKDAESVFLDPEVDFVAICTPSNSHITYIQKAIETKKHIFCEKPLDNDIKKVKDIADALAHHKEIKFQLGLNRRWDHNFLAIKNKLVKKEFGELYLINVTSYDPGLPPLDYIKVSGGLFNDMTIHDFDMLRYLSDDEVDEVYANGDAIIDSKIRPYDIDTAIITFKFKKGKQLGVILNSRQAAYGYDQRVEVLGSKGGITTDNDRPNMTIWKTAEGITHEKPLYFFLERYQQSYTNEMQNFVNKIFTNEEIVPNAMDGYKAMQIAVAAKKSLDEKKPIKIDDLKF